MNMNLTLPTDLADFVEAKVQNGDFTSSSAVVHQALRLMERVEQQNADRLVDLRDAWQDGLGSGEAVALDLEAFKAEARARLADA